MDYQEDEEEEEDEEYKEDEAFPEWVKMSKSRFDVRRSNINRGVIDKLKTRVDKKILLKNAKEMIEGIASGIIARSEALRCIETPLLKN